MKPHLTAHLNHDGHPFADIPAHLMYDVVEYLSFQRLNVTYHFGQSCFTATFNCQSPAAVQQVLDQWAEAPEETCGRDCDACGTCAHAVS